jgi:aminomethyltransferase
MEPLKTPLWQWHRQHGAKLTRFFDWEMPLEYRGVVAEHREVRERVGMFDVSHMGEFEVVGAEAAPFLDRCLTHWPSRLKVGQALYSPMCRPDGGLIDDVVVLRLGDERFWMVVNAAHRERDWRWLQAQREKSAVELVDLTMALGLIAVQGPRAQSVLDRLFRRDFSRVGRYRGILALPWEGESMVVLTRTGYTGEDGFEVFGPWQAVPALWEALYGMGVSPIGLGARDTLRLEAGLLLAGQDFSEQTSAVAAGLTRFIRFDKPNDFIGRAALWEELQRGSSQRIVGLEVAEGIARRGCPVGREEEKLGEVTSGLWSPTLRRGIALALVSKEGWTGESTVWVEIRGRRHPAQLRELPFYRRPIGQHASNQG